MRSPFKGQMSLIMMLIIAIALVFYAVTQNWSKIAVYKTQVTIATNTGAATLASMLASYGEYFIQGQLGGTLKVEASTGTLIDWIVLVVVVILAVVVTIISWGSLATATTIAVLAIVGAVLSVALSIATIIIDVTTIQPGLTKAWQKAMGNLGSMNEQFTEQGIQGMMTSVVNDPVNVPDRWDMDMDGRWNIPGHSGSDPQAKVARFSYYYSNRLNNTVMKDSPIDALRKILTQMQDQLGLQKPLDPYNPCYTSPPPPAEPELKPQCDPCCQAPMGRPSSCNRTQFYLAQCGGVDNPGCRESNLNACYVYDPLYPRADVPGSGQPKNLMHVFGEDDPDPHYKLLSGTLFPENTNGPGVKFPYFLAPVDGHPPTFDGGVFRGSDAKGTFFPFIWLLADTRPGVKGLGTASGFTPVTSTDPGCLWRANASACVTEIAASGTPGHKVGTAFYRPSALYDQIALPGCSGDDCYVNRFRNKTADVTSFEMRQIDNVTTINALMPVANDACAQNDAGVPPVRWKKGADRLSQTFVGYEWKLWDHEGHSWHAGRYDVYPLKELNSTQGEPLSCATDFHSDCICLQASPKERWRNDSMDNFSITLSDFSRTALSISTMSTISQNQFAAFIKSWKPRLEKQTQDLDTAMAALFNPNNPESITSEITRWLKGESPYQYTGTNLADLWCLPPSQNDVTQHEREFILENDGEYMIPDPSTGQAVLWGSLRSVVSCEGYNMANPTRFQNCLNNCPGSCVNLPRSLVPGFNPNVGIDCTTSPTPSQYRLNIQESRALALNQAKKFEKRAYYLDDLFTRAYKSRDAFKYAHTYLTTKLGEQASHSELNPLVPSSAEIIAAAAPFVGSAANKTPTELVRSLLDYIEANQASGPPPALGDEVIYGWFSKVPEGSNRPRGYFHAIKIKSSIPGTLPWIDTYTNWWQTKRTYELKDYTGTVRALAVRYDEDRDGGLSFLSGLSLWNAKYRNPLGAFQAVTMDNVYNNCTQHFMKIRDNSGNIVYEPNPFENTDPELKEAFMIALPLLSPGKPALTSCVQDLERLLRRGVASQTCAKYEPKCDDTKEPKCTYDLKFVPCP